MSQLKDIRQEGNTLENVIDWRFFSLISHTLIEKIIYLILY